MLIDRPNWARQSIRKTIAVFSILVISVSVIAADEQGSKFLKRPGAELPALPEFLQQQDSENIILPELPQQLKPDYQNNQRFMLEGIVLDGNHVVSDAELTAAVE